MHSDLLFIYLFAFVCRYLLGEMTGYSPILQPIDNLRKGEAPLKN